MKTFRSCSLPVLLAVGLLASSAFGQRQVHWHGHAIDSPMYRDPDLPGPKIVHVFPPKAKALWRKALQQPQADLRCKAADAFSRAKRRGVQGLDEAIPDLNEALEKEDQPAVVRLALVRALIDLEAKKSADLLWKQAKTGTIDLREQVEPALARWGHGDAKDAWVARLTAPATECGPLLLAIRCSVIAQDKRAVQPLRERVLSARTPAPIRLDAARALGKLQTSGLEKDAAALVKDTSARGLPGRLVGVSLLRHHGSKEAVEQFSTLAKDSEPAVAAIAATRLIEIDVKLAAGVRDHLLASRDSALRGHGVTILSKHETEDSLGLLGKRLDDPHPEVRIAARQALLERGLKRGQRKEVIVQGVTALGANSWRSQEQAAILLADLDHKPAGARLAELLSADRAEVFVTSAWALRRLGDKDSLPAVLKYMTAEEKRFSKGKTLPGRKDVSLVLISHQFSQLAQHVGKMKYAPAESLLRRFVPRNDKVPVNETRAAAIWALGLILEGKPSGNLASLLVARLEDTMSMPAEDERVRQFCAVTLGRLNAKETLANLRKFCPNQQMDAGAVTNSCAWAIERITGEKAKPAEVITATMRDWFLVPND